jgi:DNA-binding NarL/FixJ family response regulator
MSEAPIRVLVVDDHPMVREGLRTMLCGDGLEVVGDAGSSAEALQRCSELSPDVILLDLELPDRDGVRTLADLKRIAPRVAVLLVTMHDDPGLVRAAVSAGADGYVLKGIGRQELLDAVRAVRSGRTVFDPGLLRAAGVPGHGDRSAPEMELSAVERDVVEQIARGLTNRQIADRMRWSIATAKKYVQRVLAKLGVTDRTQAAVAALRRGLLD